ncbi:MAG TPA: PDZ domain-containing protein [Bryobacteraceae bacterium]|nr:PDZ domain-containing protein [Bryobacteraceae bacterium]
MKRSFSCSVLFAAGLGAQFLGAQPADPFQVQPAAPGYFYAYQQGSTPQVYEFRNGTLMSGGTYLGVSLAEIDANRGRELKLKETHGVEITRVESDSPAEKAGLKTGDVVLEYNGQRVEGMEQFGRLVRETPTGREVKLLISRNGAQQTIAATTATRKMKAITAGNMKDFFPNMDMPDIHLPDMPQVFTTWRSPVLGVEAESLSPQLATFFGVKEGVLVRSVGKDTSAEKAGIKAGDVITKVDGTTVTTPNELVNALHSSRSKKTFPVNLVRDKHETSVTVTVEDQPERSPGRVRVVHNSVRM